MNGTTVIVETHPLYRDAMQMLVAGLFPMDETFATGTAEEGLQLSLACNFPRRMFILDFNLPGVTGSSAIRLFRAHFPEVPIVVVSAREERQEADAALRAGATAFLSKALPLKEMQSVIRRAALKQIEQGEWHVADEIGVIASSESPALPSRQREILALVCRGLTNKEIALRLALAEVTVKMHLTQAFRNLGVGNRSQAIRAVQSLGIELAKAGTASPVGKGLKEH